MAVTKLFLRPQSLPLSTLSPKFFFPKFTILSFSSSTSRTQSEVSHHCFSYGPSLHKGTNPFRSKSTVQPVLRSIKTLTENPGQQHSEEDREDSHILDEECFIRVFNIAALRVPSMDCFDLESRLRGHLLNWPRIRNIARVAGDEVEADFVELIGDQNVNGYDVDDAAVVDSLRRRIYGKAEGDGEKLSPVLYRDKLVRTFNSKGFVNFRNLAKMSRPKKKRKKEEEQTNDGKKRNTKNNFAVVEVVEDEEQHGEDMKGLLGDEFKGRKWRGSTRLLLLDERFANKGVEELPEAIKVAVCFST